VQDERKSLSWRQLFQRHEQSEADRIRQQRLVLGIDPVLAARDRLGDVRTHELLAPRLAGAAWK
jgi:hypothetical protein